MLIWASYIYIFLSVSMSSWIFARKWPNILQGSQLHLLCAFLNLSAWSVVVSPIIVLIIWGSWLVVILDRHLIGLAVIMAGTALLLAFYSIMLWWRTQWQSSSMYLLANLLFNIALCLVHKFKLIYSIYSIWCETNISKYWSLDKDFSVITIVGYFLGWFSTIWAIGNLWTWCWCMFFKSEQKSGKLQLHMI